MQEFSTGRYAGFIETNDALISGVRGISRRLSFYIRSGLRDLLGRMEKAQFVPPGDTLESRHEIAIMYAGHTRESLNMISERMAIPDGRYTLGQLLCNLYRRGDQWVNELDHDRLVCTVNGREAKLFDTIEAGAEIRIFS